MTKERWHWINIAIEWTRLTADEIRLVQGVGERLHTSRPVSKELEELLENLFAEVQWRK